MLLNRHIWVRKTQRYRDNITYKEIEGLSERGRFLEEEKHSRELKLNKIVVLIFCMGAEQRRSEFAR